MLSNAYSAISSSKPRCTIRGRSEVANTIRYRRSKGTAVLLEQLVRDVTGWDAHVVEFFNLVAATQHVNRPRPTCQSIDLRDKQRLAFLGTPFEHVVHTGDVRSGGDILSHEGIDVRTIDTQSGRYNIPNIGIFLWRLASCSLTDVPAQRAFPADEHRYFFNPLGYNTQVFTHPRTGIDVKTQLVEILDVAAPITRSMLALSPSDYYGAGKSLLLTTKSDDESYDIPLERIVSGDLSDKKDDAGNPMRDGNGNPVWIDTPQDRIVIDPVLGRIIFPRHELMGSVSCTFYYGFSANIGGGEYHRADSLSKKADTIEQVPDRHMFIQEALNALAKCPGGGVVEITDSGRNGELPVIHATTNQQIELRSADLRRPLLVLEGEKGIPEMLISGDEGSSVTINGLVISNGILRVSGKLSRLTLKHCTLVPGLTLAHDGTPLYRKHPGLVVESPDTVVEIDHCIIGALRVAETAQVYISDSIVDATEKDGVAYAGYRDPEFKDAPLGGSLSLESCTIIGTVETVSLALASNSIFLAHSRKTTRAPLYAEKRQEGCVRFSYLPVGAQAPVRQYQCVLASEDNVNQVEPKFTSLRYGEPGYCQLSQRTVTSIWQGADNESEMGAFRRPYQSQREVNLHSRLDEYLRFGFDRNIFYMT